MFNHQKAPFKGGGGLVVGLFGGLLKKASGVPRRFPYSVAFLVAATLCLLFMIWGKAGTTLTSTITYFCCISAIFCGVLQLWREREPQPCRRWLTGLLCGEAVLAIFAVWYCWYSRNDDGEAFISLFFLAGFVMAAGLLLIYRREKDGLPAWCLAQNVLVNISVCFFVGCIMAGGVALLLFALHSLFGLTVTSKVSASIAVLSLFTLPLWLFMGYTPEGETLDSLKPQGLRFINAVTRWLFIPLLIVYGLVLYAYAAKILFTLTLPQGGVCWLVICFILGSLAIQTLGAPSNSSKGESSNRSCIFLLGRALPQRGSGVGAGLLILMSVAIGRRVHDYGLTPPRLYVIIFNLWAYIIIIYDLLPQKFSCTSLPRWRKFCLEIAALLLTLFLAAVVSSFLPRPADRTPLGTKPSAQQKYSSVYYSRPGSFPIPAGTTHFLPVELRYHGVCEDDSAKWRIATSNGEAVLLVTPAQLRALCPAGSDTIPASTRVALPLLRPAGATCVIHSLELYNYPGTPNSDGKVSGTLSLSGCIFQ